MIENLLAICVRYLGEEVAYGGVGLHCDLRLVFWDRLGLIWIDDHMQVIILADGNAGPFHDTATYVMAYPIDVHAKILAWPVTVGRLEQWWVSRSTERACAR
jgi:hypothetical protein